MVKHETSYLAFAPVGSPPTDAGRSQFHDYETHGITPANPDPFFVRLCEGRKWLDWQRNQLRDSFRRFLARDPEADWHGWLRLREDWIDDLDTLRLLLNWCRVVPDWVCKKETPPVARRG